MAFCVSTDVGTWTNLSTFEPDPDHSPDAGTGKSEIENRSNRYLTQSRRQLTGCTAERYCLLHVVVQGQGSFSGQLNFFCTTYGCGATGRQSIFGFWPIFFVGGKIALYRVPF